MAKTVITETKTRAVDTQGGSAADVVRVVEVASVTRSRLDAEDVRDFLAALELAGVPDDVPIRAAAGGPDGWLTNLAVTWRTKRAVPFVGLETGGND